MHTGLYNRTPYTYSFLKYCIWELPLECLDNELNNNENGQ